jgi:hypothetical protein
MSNWNLALEAGRQVKSGWRWGQATAGLRFIFKNNAVQNNTHVACMDDTWHVLWLSLVLPADDKAIMKYVTVCHLLLGCQSTVSLSLFLSLYIKFPK